METKNEAQPPRRRKTKHRKQKKNKMSDTFAMNKVYEDDRWPWGDQRDNKKSPARVFWGCWPSTLLGILCSLSFYKNAVFPWKRVILFISQCLPFFLLGFFHFSFFTFCLSLSCFCFFPSLLSCLFLLPCFFVVLSCFVSLRLFHEKKTSNITFERILFINYFCFSGFPVLFCHSNPFCHLFFFVISVVCFGQHKCFLFQRRRFLKHSFCFAHCAKLSFLLRAVFGSKFGWCSKHCKKGISAQD